MKSTWPTEAIIRRSRRREFRDKDSLIGIGKLSVVGTLTMILPSCLGNILKEGTMDDRLYPVPDI